MGKKITKRDIKEGLEQIPIETILIGTKGNRQFTHKQKQFAKGVAMGKTQAQAYRDAYNTKASPTVVAGDASKLAGTPHISLLIDAYRASYEAREYQKPERLRELVIHQLTVMALNPEVKDAQRIKSLELLGKVSEVGAFTERKETKVIHESSKLKERLLDQLKTVIDGDINEVTDNASGESLLAELLGDNKQESATPTTPPPTETDPHSDPDHLHINPHTQTPSPTKSQRFAPDGVEIPDGKWVSMEKQEGVGDSKSLEVEVGTDIEMTPLDDLESK